MTLVPDSWVVGTTPSLRGALAGDDRLGAKKGAAWVRFRLDPWESRMRTAVS